MDSDINRPVKARSLTPRECSTLKIRLRGGIWPGAKRKYKYLLLRNHSGEFLLCTRSVWRWWYWQAFLNKHHSKMAERQPGGHTPDFPAQLYPSLCIWPWPAPAYPKTSTVPATWYVVHGAAKLPSWIQFFVPNRLRDHKYKRARKRNSGGQVHQ